jgi:O-antigen/teichoic acid export membrane protein
MGASIAVARYLGPEKLGYFSAVNFPVMMICSASGTGMALATRKYMADFLGTGQFGIARAVYEFSYKYQLLGALIITVIGLAIVAAVMPHQHLLMAVLMVLSILPGMMTVVAAQANLAFEDASKNTLSSMGYLVSYSVAIVLTLRLNWDLPGVASALLLGRTVEVVMRTVPLRRFLRSLPLDTLPVEVKGRIRRFCLQAIGIQILVSIVWERSEIFFLTAFSDMKEVAFYSVSAGLVDRLLVFPKVFGMAAGVSLMAESARERFRVSGIVYNACRYLSLVAIPLHIGAALLARQAVWVVYGTKYMPAVPVMVIAALFAVPRAFQELPSTLMRAADRQWDLMRCLIITGVLNAALDLALIPHHGAIGAAIGNGVAQGFGVGLLWFTAHKMYEFTWPVASTIRIVAATAVMGLATFGVSRLLSPLYGMLAGIAAGVPVYLFMIRAFHALDAEDYTRLMLVESRLPSGLRSSFDAAVRFMVPRYDLEVAAKAISPKIG